MAEGFKSTRRHSYTDLEDPREPWQNRAFCAGQNVDAMNTERRKALCQKCPVVEPCLAQAMADPSLTDVWGGTDETERKELRGRSKVVSLDKHRRRRGRP